MAKKELILDGTKLLYHLERLNAWNKGLPVFPVFVEISPVGFCNQACIFCAYEYLTRSPGRLDTKRTLSLLDECKRLGVRAVFFSGEGEPLLHPDAVKMIAHAHAKGLDCALNTNGILFTGEVSQKILKCLSWVRFSVNAGSAASYRRIHQAGRDDFKVLLKNLKDAVRIKRKGGLAVSLGVQLVYLGQGFAEILGFAKTLKDIGLDYFAVKQFNKHPLSSYNVKVKSGEIEKLKFIEGLSGKNFQVAIRQGFDAAASKRNYKKCLGFDFFAEVKCDGGVYPCGPLLGIKRYCYGSIYESSFKEIWLGKRRKKVVADIHAHLDIDQCMPNCRLHTINDFLWKLKSVPAHVNFI